MPQIARSRLPELAAGVHSADASLKVIPGAFMSENAFSNHTLKGSGPAIANMLNDGTLDGIDLHTYNDTKFAPIEKTENGNWYWQFSPQSDFDEVKEACGITWDITFYATEYGFKNNTQGITDEYCAKRSLTCVWANLAVARKDGTTPATGFALIWQLFAPDTSDLIYGLATHVEPTWVGNPAGKTFQMVMKLTDGMDMVSVNDPVKGAFVAEGNGRKMWVWQNLPQWTASVGESITLTGIPSGSSGLSVYRWHSWDGPYREIALGTASQATVEGLTPNETYMFVAEQPTVVLRMVPSGAACPRTEGRSYLIIQSSAKARPALRAFLNVQGRLVGQSAPASMRPIIFGLSWLSPAP